MQPQKRKGKWLLWLRGNKCSKCFSDKIQTHSVKSIHNSLQDNMLNVDPSIVPQLEAEFRRGWQMKRVKAEVESKRAAKYTQMRHKSIEGLGQKIGSIPGDAYHFWGTKLGYGCWDDKKFMSDFLRDNPQCRVNSGGTKEISVGWVPSSSPRSRTVY